jgi:flavin reductase (DIM6/NTAB) family NADH-FMN oxidoreductase RutF
MARQNFKPGTLEAPLPAVMVSVGDMENSNILTVAWTGILSSDPPRTYISVRPSRYSHKILTEKKEFVINLTSEQLAWATDYVGIYTGAKVDKFEKCRLTKAESAVVSAPTIAEAPVALECRVFDVINSGTHDIFMADIVNVSCDERLLDGNGKICFDRANLIAYSHGEYYALGKKLGRFGFSTDKKKKPTAKKRGCKSKKSSSGGKEGKKS